MENPLPFTENELDEAIRVTTDAISSLEKKLEKIDHDRQIELEFGACQETGMLTRKAQSFVAELDRTEADLSEQLKFQIDQLEILKPTGPIWVHNLARERGHESFILDFLHIPAARERIVRKISAEIRKRAQMRDTKELER